MNVSTSRILRRSFAFTMGLPMILAWSMAAGEYSGPVSEEMTTPVSERYVPRAIVMGTMRFEGSNTLYPLMTRLAKDFGQRQPNVRIDVKGDGSSGPLMKFLKGPQVGTVALYEERSFPTILTSSRELYDSERKEFESNHGYEPMEIAVAADAVAIYVHKDNPLKAITLDQVDAIFSQDRLRGSEHSLQQWGQLGLGEGWLEQPIRLYGRDKQSGTQQFFRDHALAGGDFTLGVREEPGAASVILSLGLDRLGLGYSGLGIRSSQVRVLPLAEAEGVAPVYPSAVTVANKTYPLHRVLYVYIDNPPHRSLPTEIQEFFTFLRSVEGQTALVKAGFFPLPLRENKSSPFARNYLQPVN